MNITDIRIRRTYCENRLRALVSITIDHDLALHDIKIIQVPTACLSLCPAGGTKTANFGTSAIPSPCRQDSSWSRRCWTATNSICNSRKLPTKISHLGKIGVADFYFKRSTLLRVENRSRVAVIVYLFLPLRSVRPPASDTTASAAITALRSCAPVSGLPLSPPLR